MSPTLRFSRDQRLISRVDFKSVFAAQKRLRHGSLRIYYNKNAKTFFRLGLVVSRKFGKAHQRNFFKRLVREAFRQYPQRHKMGLDIIVIPAVYKKKLLLEDIKEDLFYLLDKCLQSEDLDE